MDKKKRLSQVLIHVLNISIFFSYIPSLVLHFFHGLQAKYRLSVLQIVNYSFYGNFIESLDINRMQIKTTKIGLINLISFLIFSFF